MLVIKNWNSLVPGAVSAPSNKTWKTMNLDGLRILLWSNGWTNGHSRFILTLSF